jgi:hypothetical protein
MLNLTILFFFRRWLVVPDTASYIRGWMQMVLTPNDLFSWNNKYSKYMAILLHYIHYNGFIANSFSYARWLTLCMLVSLSREGVVFFVFLSSSHLTEIHVLPPPVSETNWRFLFRPGDSPPPSSSKMASSFTGSAHSPFSGYDTLVLTLAICVPLASLQSWAYVLRKLTPALAFQHPEY